jgi:hypothetical protein
VILGAKGEWIEMGDELIHKRQEDLGECLRQGSKGEIPMSINSPTFLNFIIIVY